MVIVTNGCVKPVLVYYDVLAIAIILPHSTFDLIPAVNIELYLLINI